MKVIKLEDGVFEIHPEGTYYKYLNIEIQKLSDNEAKKIILRGVNGQRYIGAGLSTNLEIEIYGVPGNDLGVFMDGPHIKVFDNAQDGVGNTMNSGRIYVHGHAGDVLGYGMRGGRVFILGDVGYRVGIHMKGYKGSIPILVAGGTAGHFFGEYQAGGVLVLLGLDKKPGKPICGDYLGTGTHGGVMFVRGEVDKRRVGKEVGFAEPDEDDMRLLNDVLSEFSSVFKIPFQEIMSIPFTKLYPRSTRPYGPLYSSRWQSVR